MFAYSVPLLRFRLIPNGRERMTRPAGFAGEHLQAAGYQSEVGTPHTRHIPTPYPHAEISRRNLAPQMPSLCTRRHQKQQKPATRYINRARQRPEQASSAPDAIRKEHADASVTPAGRLTTACRERVRTFTVKFPNSPRARTRETHSTEKPPRP